MQIGRAEIFTSELEITRHNVTKILQDAYTKHLVNSNRIDELLNFEAGVQPLQRKEPKKVRSDIDVQSIDNVAHEITEFNLGFKWGNPITIVQRGEKDSGNEKETEAISLLNECYAAENIKAKTQALGRFVEIGGVGYTYVDVKAKEGSYQDGDSYFSLDVLDPRWTFVVRSSRYVDHRILMAVTYSQGDDMVLHFTCFTEDMRYDITSYKIKDKNGKETGEEAWNIDKSGVMINALGCIPIVEHIRAFDRMGCFERFIDELNTLNLMISDFSNDVENNTQAIWLGVDIEFPVDEDGNEERPRSGEWVVANTTQDGHRPDARPLVVNYDYPGMLQNIAIRRACILEKACVPASSDNTNGATGVAMDDAIGWTKAELNAQKQQGIMESSKMDEIKVVLQAINVSPFIKSDNPLLGLRYIDVEPNVKRMKTYEMVTKANAFATYVSHGIDGRHALAAINAFSDPNQVWEDSKDLIEKYQASIFDKEQPTQAVGGAEEKEPNADRLEGDVSDQIDNSPSIDKK